MNKKLSVLDNLTQEERVGFLFKHFLDQHGIFIFTKFIAESDDHLAYFICFTNYLLSDVTISVGVYETLLFQIKRDGPRDFEKKFEEFKKGKKDIFDIVCFVIGELDTGLQLQYWNRFLSFYEFISTQREVNEMEETIKLN